MNSHKLRAWLVWLLCGVIVIVALYNLAYTLLTKPPPDLSTWFQTVLNGLLPIVFAVVGSAIVALQSGNVIGWLLMLPVLAVLPDSYITREIQSYTVPPSPAPPSLLVVAWLANASWVFFIFPLILIPLLFPTGKPLTPRWRWVVALAVIMPALFLVVATFADRIGPDSTTYGVQWSLSNPIGFIPPEIGEGPYFFVPWALSLLAIVILSLVSMVLRYRRAGTIEKEQIKWLLFACVLFSVVYVPSIVTKGEMQGTLGEIVNIVLPLAVMAFPIAIGIAILRYRLWDIDILIRRTLTYAIVTALLLVVFFGSVVLLQQVFASFTGSGQNELVTVLSTLAIAALFVPLRNRIQSVIDRRFNRRKYDAQQILNEFGNTVRDETDLERLTGRLMQVVEESMQPRNVSVWLSGKTRK